MPQVRFEVGVGGQVRHWALYIPFLIGKVILLRSTIPGETLGTSCLLYKEGSETRLVPVQCIIPQS